MSEATILLVDDNAAHRSLVKRVITRAQISLPISEAASLLDARRSLFSSERKVAAFALAILDLNLSDGRSTTLIAEIRASKEHRTLPVLVLSTSPLEADVRESYDSGADCYLIKADDMSAFSSEIAAAIRFLIGAKS